MSNTIPISAITDHDRLSGLSKRVIALLTLVMLVDSFDQAALAFAAPSLIKAWGISALSMGSVFSLQLVGLMIGGILLGYVGDRFGRKVAVVWGVYLFGILSLATAIRANGVGWALSVAKIGAIAGPFVGGILMASNASVKELFLAAAIPLVVCIVSAALLRRLYNSHVDSDTAVASPPFEQAGTNL